MTIDSAIATFGASAKAKLSSPVAEGQPEDQLRAPFEALLADVANLASFRDGDVVAVGETAVHELKTRPDYGVTVRRALAGFAELKAPGKGADPRAFADKHDQEQWQKLRSLPNLLYTDGNQFSLWQNGDIVGQVLRLEGDIASSGTKLRSVPGLMAMFEAFLNWRPQAPRSARELAHTAARLCRLLRDEVTEQIERKSEALCGLAADWRQLLFPDATNERFADGYAQAVTFGLLMARARNIPLASGIDHVAVELSRGGGSLIGEALRLLTGNAESQRALKTSLSTLTRVLDAVDWNRVSSGESEAWLYFYEEFLDVYDRALRKQTGSYYTPPEVVEAMAGLVDQALKSPRFGQFAGLASAAVTLADPATGTGTFLLGVLRRIAQNVTAEQGAGAVPAAIEAALRRIVAFEIQLGPFAVAQLRILAEVLELCKKPPLTQPRLFVTDTLGDPHDAGGYFPGYLPEISRSRREANRIKESERITVVLGNPPYKEKAKGRGGWVEQASANAKEPAPLAAWMPPAELGAHAKHLRNLYVYFWRWATWKVFDYGADGKKPGPHNGIVCFITVAGFLNGPGFSTMRAYLRETCDDVWVIDCTPEGHQPPVNSRIFQGVQQPVCIVMASRSERGQRRSPAMVRYCALPSGGREVKFDALKRLTLDGQEWIECSTEFGAPFLPAATGVWANFLPLEEVFLDDSSGVMPGRTWIIAPDVWSLEHRWDGLKAAPLDRKELLFHPHLIDHKLGDRHIGRLLKDALPGFAVRSVSVLEDKEAVEKPIRYGFRSLDRQWIIPDKRLINRPNPELWKNRGDRQIYLTAVNRTSPSAGPALTFTANVPDLDHYNGRGGRAYPLWSDAAATEPNIKPALLVFLAQHYQAEVDPEEVMAYLAGVASHPAFTAKFQDDLRTPGLRIPITADHAVLEKVAALGRRVLWLQTFGDRMWSDRVEDERPRRTPLLPEDRRPVVPEGGEISASPSEMPDTMEYDAEKQRLLIGHGYVEHVTPAMWNYEVSGMSVLQQWFSYRKRDRTRPQIGDRRRPPSPLSSVQPDHWLSEYTTDLLEVLNVLGFLIDLEPAQARLLDEVLNGPLLDLATLRERGALSTEREPVEAPVGPLFPGETVSQG